MDYSQLKTGTHKIANHLDHLIKIRNSEFVAPINISLWPTAKCQLSCDYCCCRNEENKNNTLNLEILKPAILTLKKYGLKAIEYSGGGEPLLWESFEDSVRYFHAQGIKLSLITNGLELCNISKDVLSCFEWIRVSLQSKTHAESVDWDNIPKDVRFTASHMYTSLYTLNALHEFLSKRKITTRIAVVQPFTGNIQDVKNIVKLYDPLFFFSEKEQGVPAGCYMPWIRAAIDWNGNFLPCVSVQLTKDSVGKIDKSFKLCNIKDIEKWILNNKPHDMGYRCEPCNCGKQYNDFIDNFMKEHNDKDFV